MPVTTKTVTFERAIFYILWLALVFFLYKSNMMFLEDKSYSVMIFTVSYGVFALWLLRPWG